MEAGAVGRDGERGDSGNANPSRDDLVLPGVLGVPDGDADSTMGESSAEWNISEELRIERGRKNVGSLAMIWRFNSALLTLGAR